MIHEILGILPFVLILLLAWMYGPYVSSWSGWQERSIHECGYVETHGFRWQNSICRNCGNSGGWVNKIGRQGFFYNWIWKETDDTH